MGVRGRWHAGGARGLEPRARLSGCVDVGIEPLPRGEYALAEHASDVRTMHVPLQQLQGRETGLFAAGLATAFITPEAGLAVVALDVALDGQ